MIDSAPRLPTVVAAPVAAPMPTPPDRVPSAQTAAHPFAELLRQNRLAAATPPAAAPPAPPASNADARPAAAAADPSGDGDAPPVRPAATPRDAAPAKARLATPPNASAAAGQAPPPAPSTEASRDDTRATAGDAKGPPATLDASLIAGAAAFARPDVAAPAEPGTADGGEGARGKNATASDGAGARGGASSAAGALPFDAGSSPLGAAAGATASAAPDRDAARVAGDEPNAVRDAGKESSGGAPALASFAGLLAESSTAHASAAAPASEHASHDAAAATLAATAFGGNAVPGSGSAAVASTLPTPLHSPDFAAAFGVQVSVLAKDGVQRAELHLNPVEMGPVSIQITLDGNQARVDFGADAAATRHAIEAGLPELASALRDAGFTLAGGGVAQHSGSNGRGRDDADMSRAAPRDTPAAGNSLEATAQRLTRRVAAGGIDLFA